MKRSKFSESQVLAVLKAVEAGRTVAEVCRETGISTGTYFKWKTKYGGMTASDVRRLRTERGERAAQANVCGRQPRRAGAKKTRNGKR